MATSVAVLGNVTSLPPSASPGKRTISGKSRRSSVSGAAGSNGISGPLPSPTSEVTTSIVSFQAPLVLSNAISRASATSCLASAASCSARKRIQSSSPILRDVFFERSRSAPSTMPPRRGSKMPLYSGGLSRAASSRVKSHGGWPPRSSTTTRWGDEPPLASSCSRKVWARVKGSDAGRSATGEKTSNASKPAAKPNGLKLVGTPVNSAVRPPASFNVSARVATLGRSLSPGRSMP